ncbi:MAG TPA: glycerol-3-phosphate acyltransferase [Anaerolineales bacterium]|nr:glycerol-3-phosphate acyltransferase [Anaerolineales bacterium]
MASLSFIIFPLIGYISGSLPFSIWITRFAKGVDVRDGGSGHAGTTNTVRQAGFGWGALVLVLDLAKGFLPVFLALTYSAETWVVTFTGALAVVGHCWPLFAQFRGGMGLATFGGALAAVTWIAFFAGIGLLLAMLVIIRHRARASLITGMLLAPLCWILNLRGVEFWIAVAGGIVIAWRFFSDWNRQYRGL